MKNTLNKIIAFVAVATCTLQATSIVPETFMHSDYSIVASAAETLPANAQVIKVASQNRGYIIIPHSNGTTCTLYRVFDTVNASNQWTFGNESTLIIPDSITNPTTKKTYTITELGYNGQSIFHNYDGESTRVVTVQLPNKVTKINSKALYYTEMNKLKTVKLNLETLKDVAADVFGNETTVKEVYAYNSSNKTYYSTTASTVNFYKAFNFVNQQYTINGKLLKAKSSTMDGKMKFLDALACSPYSKQAAYVFAKEIAASNNINNSANTALQKYEMAYNYVKTHHRYSRFVTSDGRQLDNLSGSALSNLAFHSGVCGSIGHAFATLCKAAGVEALCAGTNVNGSASINHCSNVVMLNSKYYLVDCGGFNVFMQSGNSTMGTWTTLDAYDYGIDTTFSECMSTTRTVTFANSFCPNYSYLYVKDLTNQKTHAISVKLTDKNNTNKKYVDYQIQNLSSGVCTLNDIMLTSSTGLYIDSNTYYNLTVKIGSKTLTLNNVFHGNRNNYITVDGVKYNVIVETLDYATTSMQPHSSYKNYFQITITKA